MSPARSWKLSSRADSFAESYPGTYKEFVANPEITDEELLGLDEFALLHENAEQAGVSGPLPLAQRLAATEPALVPELVLVDVTPSAPERHEQMSKAQLGAVALVQGERTSGMTSRRSPCRPPWWRGADSYFVNDYFVNDEDAAAFAESAPGFRQTHIVEGAGHSVQGDQPRKLIEILRGILH